MSFARSLGMGLLAGAALAAAHESPAQAQVAQTYQVRRGDTLFGVARSALYDGVTRNQMILAIFRANQSTFAGGNINLMEVGVVLAIPSRDEVARISTAEADRQVRELLAAKPVVAPPPMAAVKPAPGATRVKPPAAVPAAGIDASRRYRDGLAMEQRGDLKGALAAFLEAGEAGNGLAQKKLGEIYDNGNSVVARDYQVALKWYQKAREQGVEIEKPIQRTIPR